MKISKYGFNVALVLLLVPGITGSAFADTGTITSRDYVDDLLDTKQAQIPALNTNTIVTYGTSDGIIGQQTIVTTLGTDATATTSPTTGAVVTGMNTRQSTVNGTADYVMTGTGTAGTVGEKPVYSATNNYDIALVTAQTINTAATDAANSELTCVDNDCLLWQINTSGPTGISTRIYLDPSINGTSYCYRGLSGSRNTDGTCTADTLSYLGASGNKSGKWGVVFPYGDVSGISVCSTQSGTTNTAATDAQSTILDGEYTQQSGVGGNSGGYCWCKMENPDNSAARWVFRTSYSVSDCALYCAYNCAYRVLISADVRGAVFGIQ